METPKQEEILKERVGLDITFTSDMRGELLDTLGVEDDDGLVPGLGLAGFGSEELGRAIYMPTTSLLDHNGVIRWLHRTDTYRVRAKPAAVLAAVDEVFGAPGSNCEVVNVSATD